MKMPYTLWKLETSVAQLRCSLSKVTSSIVTTNLFQKEVTIVIFAWFGLAQALNII